MSLRRTVDATVEPVTLQEAKDQCRPAGSADDALITRLIKSARQQAETSLGRSLITQTWVKTLDHFPDAIRLSYSPIISITSVSYLDTLGAPQTLSSASYTLDNKTEPGYLVPAYAVSWPSTYGHINSVTVTYTAGYGATAASVPEPIKQWILVQVATMYEHRESVVVGQPPHAMPFIQGLIDQYRLFELA